MTFYSLGSDQFSARANKKFGYASGFGPLKDGMPFLTPEALERANEFWKVNPRVPGIIVGETGSKWPDCMMNGYGNPLFFVSDKIVKSLSNEGIPIARLTQMPVATIKARSLRDKPPPAYYVLEASPGIEMDYPASGVALAADGRPLIYPAVSIQWKLKLSTWNQTDLFGWPFYQRTEPNSLLLCTKRIVDLAEREGWTNVRFDPIEAI